MNRAGHLLPLWEPGMWGPGDTDSTVAQKFLSPKLTQPSFCVLGVGAHI